MKDLIILRGVPNAGKSSFAELLHYGNENSVICSADEYFMDQKGRYKFSMDKLPIAHEYCYAKAKRAMMEETSLVIIDNTNSCPKEFQKYIDMAHEYGYNYQTIIVEKCHKDGNNGHNVPEETRTKMEEKIKNSICLK